ncbi:restriction endonuclease [Dolosigranulum pigrum]|uniref:Eco47II family restriction endonuclease n=1 Tax=Dolosigranulum pigrum TaxID=29394 RepID=UPI000DC2E73D|nr:Eco47II family restriction endonuclease [Dolosigranulum pigrum]QTJ53369.1 Eco47II family restriction endonuclease [Dolosigranulum pigrum]RAN58273.1 restriction endonuclease [Dolosigranulum pigrum]
MSKIDNYNLKFISRENLKEHVAKTIRKYDKSLKAMDLDKFNKNIIDPIKLLFDKNVYDKSYEEIIELELYRQRDKTNNNAIGYFHQNIFQYFTNCEVPTEGWDVIYHGKEKTYYVEMKNKWNTMNSSSQSSTYIKMSDHLLNSQDNKNSVCALVEIIARKSQNIPWTYSIQKTQTQPNENLRRISIDNFYNIVIDDKNAFRDLCFTLPIIIEELVSERGDLKVEEDSVFEELDQKDHDMLVALYKLAFNTYEGFNFNMDRK